MKFVTAIAAAALIGGVGHLLAAPSAADASPMCNADVTADGGLLYAQIYEAEPIKKKPPRVKAILPKQILGAKMYLNAEKGVTKEYLHRAAMCHMKANTPAYEHDPLRVDGIKSLQVYPAGGAFIIALTGEDRSAGKQIWERAETLTTEVDSATAKRKASKKL